MRMALLLALLAGPAWAQAPLTAAEFEALVEGRTLTYGTVGSDPYGVEHYHPDRRVTWAWFADGVCHAGEWYAEGPPEDTAICFLYDFDPDPKCWKLYQEGAGIRAVFLDDQSTVLYEVVEDPRGLVCGGVGV